MGKLILIWIAAFIITAATAVYQRTTGPTYPVTGEAKLPDSNLQYKFYRSHGGDNNHTVSINLPDSLLSAKLFWKRYKTNDEWNSEIMVRNGDTLSAELPHQPPAGKLLYYIEIDHSKGKINVPEENVIIRFKGDVPVWILIPHVIAMFGAMLLSTRTGLEIFRKNPDVKKLTIWTIGFLLVGGFILGPLVQYYAFGAFWTGFPFGTDLTDNKTLIGLIVWVIAYFMYKRTNRPEMYALAAAVVLLIVFLIPHSAMGSELDYSKMENAESSLIPLFSSFIFASVSKSMERGTPKN